MGVRAAVMPARQVTSIDDFDAVVLAGALVRLPMAP